MNSRRGKSSRAQEIKRLNDVFRMTFEGGNVLLTCGVQALGPGTVAAALQKVRTYADFTKDNDPYGEHDFGSFEIHGNKFFWKIDHYNLDMTAGSEDPAKPEATTRVLTLMLASEY